MNNIKLFQRQTENKIDWSSRDWITFLNALYTDVTQDTTLISVKDRLIYENRGPKVREIIAILDIIKLKYILSSIDTTYISQLQRYNITEINNLNTLTYDVSTKTFTETVINFPNIVTERVSAGIPFTDAGNDWQGRLMIVGNRGFWKEGTNHSDYNSATQKYNSCEFNADFSVRSANNKNLDGTDIGGFPLVPPDANTGYVDGNPIQCPNGDIILWVQNRGTNASAWNGVNFSIYQYRSTDGGRNFVYELDVCVALGYTTVAQRASLQGFYENLVIGNDILIPMTEIPVSLANTRVRHAKSSNNGLTWSFITDITSLGEGVGPNNETGVIHLGGTNLGAIIRTETSDFSVTYKRTSNDLGLTWGALVNISEALGHCAVHQPHLIRIGENIYLGGRDMASFTSGPFRRNCIWRTTVSNFFETSSTIKIPLDPFYTGNGATDITTGDAGYTRIITNNNNTLTCFGYYGQAEQAIIYKYKVEPSPIPSIKKYYSNYPLSKTLSSNGFYLPLDQDSVFIVGIPTAPTTPVLGGIGIIGRPYNRLASGNFYWSCEGTNRPELWIDPATGLAWAIFDGSGRMRSVTTVGNSIHRAGYSFGVWLWPDDGQPAGTQMVYRDSSAVTTSLDDRTQTFLNNAGKMVHDFGTNGVAVNATSDQSFFNDGPVLTPVHFAVTNDGTQIRMYKNAILQTLDVVNNGSMAGQTMTNYNTSQQAHIGMRQTNTSTWDLGFVGKMRQPIAQPVVWTEDDILNKIMVL